VATATPHQNGMSEREVVTDDGLLKFVVSDPLEEYRAKTMHTKEPETIRWIESLEIMAGPGGARFWDVGSNIGIFTLYAAARFPRADIVSFEPFFPNFVKLKANITANRLDNVTPVWVALHNRGGVARFGIQDERLGASGNVVVEDSDASRFKASERVLQMRGDSLPALGLPAPTLLKIDVDGIEQEIIEGMTSVLADPALRSVLVEINSKEAFSRISRLLEPHGLRPDDAFNLLEDHSRTRRAKDAKNTAENWIFTKT
jgi:FkbM family methyltransferase